MCRHLIKLCSRIEKETIDEHRRTRVHEDAARDFIGVYIEEMDKQIENNPDTTFSSCCDTLKNT